MTMKQNRRQTRKYAFQVLYAHEFYAEPDAVTYPEDDELSIDEAYAQSIIDGVLKEKATLNEMIQLHSKTRKVEHLDKVDRTILRLAIWEIAVAQKPIEPSIAINEAVRLAKEFGSDNSYKLVNGILDGFVKGRA